jgi:23S rRNA-intervening sequence protein
VKAKTFEDLLVWKKAHAYVLDIYRITKQFPKSEIFGLTAQMRRAAVSIPANIAEGFKKKNATGEDPHLKHISGFARGIEVLFNPGRGFGLREHRGVATETRRSLENA